MAEKKTFLFLQGHPTFFCVRLGDALKAEGHQVRKVRLSGQDILFWPRLGAHSYRGGFARWRVWLTDYVNREGVTDIIYYADRHPYHVEALAVARATGIRAWALEFGYLRPDWLTLEPEAMGAFSRFPKDPETISKLGEAAGPLDRDEHESVFGHTFREEALFDIARNIAHTAFMPLYPLYKSDAPFSMVEDYYYWIKNLLTTDGAETRASKVQEWCESPGADFNLLAMQLAHDYQIRASTHYDHLIDMVEEIFASFAAHAPSTRKLIIKQHPLDNGYQNWPRRIGALKEKYGLEQQVRMIRGGDLGVLVRNSKGVVLANSTVGLHAVRAAVPTIALGEAVYDIPGITHQAGLDQFWMAPEPVDARLERMLVRAMAGEIQVHGSFYDRQGQKAAIAELVDRLTRRPYPAWALDDQAGQNHRKT